jgi:hypothetical protein
MASERQTSANRRNAAKSTGPITPNGKLQSRRNALRHGLTAATVVPAMEDAEEFEQFEAAIKADYQPVSAVEQELVSRLASLFWRLRRSTLIETSLFQQQGRGAIQHKFGPQPEPDVAGLGMDMLYRLLRSPQTSQPSTGTAPTPELGDREINSGRGLENTMNLPNPATVLLRLCHLNSFPIERINRYETALWRQAVQTLFLLDACKKRLRSL